jgi:hypothetical protein
MRKEGTPIAFVSERGPCAPVREGERSAIKGKRKKVEPEK